MQYCNVTLLLLGHYSETYIYVLRQLGRTRRLTGDEQPLTYPGRADGSIWLSDNQM